ncbi:MAG: hypothetical protein GXY32_05655 [Ruminococcaceae bacterium]|nr:hypothetical protein [Oscillospiraceae bacterium]
MKKLFSALLALALGAALLAGCTSGTLASSSQPAAGSSAPPVSSSTPEQQPQPGATPKAITILHTNDIHGYFSATDALSGAPAEGVIGLDAAATYTLCTNDFLAGGGDLYTMLAQPFANQLPLKSPQLAPIEQALTHYLAQQQANLSPALEGRIQTS